MTVAADDSYAVTGDSAGTLQILDTQSWEPMLTIQAHNDEITSVDITIDGAMVATGSADGTFKLWNAATWQEVMVVQAHETQESGFFRGLMTLAFSPDTRYLVTGAVDGTVRIWDVETGMLRHDLVGHDWWVLNSTFSPDGTLVATSSEEVIIWDVATGELLQTLSPDNWSTTNIGIWGLDFSPDGTKLSYGRTDFIMDTWQLPPSPWHGGQDVARKVQEVESGSGFLFETEYSPDGKKIALSGLGNLVEIRDADSGELLLDLPHPAAVNRVTFTAGGANLLTVGFDDIARIFALDLDQLMALAEARITRSLTDEECQQYLHLDACP
jgi:WD40 repeat protein